MARHLLSAAGARALGAPAWTGGVWRVVGQIGREITAFQATRALSSLDARQLADIGLARSEIEVAARFGRRGLR